MKTRFTENEIVEAVCHYARREEEKAIREAPAQPDLVTSVLEQIRFERASENKRRAESSWCVESSDDKGLSWLQIVWHHWRMVGLSLVAIVGAVVATRLFSSETEIQLAGISRSVLGGGLSLPRNLRLFPQKNRIELYEGSDRIGGTMSPTTSQSGIHTFVVTMQRHDAAGRIEKVRGDLWVTNAPGRMLLQSEDDVAGAFLHVAVELPDSGQISVKMEFGKNR